MILYLVFVAQCYTQAPCEGHHLAFKAEQFYRQGEDSERALELYARAFEAGIKNGRIVLDALSCAVQIQDTASVSMFLAYGLSIGFDCSDYERLWFRIGKGLDLKSLLSEIDTRSIINKYKTSLNQSLIASVNVFSERDQLYRSEDVVDWNLQLALDSLNWSELKQIIERLGYLPTYSELGLDGSDDLEILFYHMNKNELQWFLPYIIKNIQDYESNLGHEVLYQLERIGMDQGIIYSISEGYEIFELAPRKKMKNGLWCQSFGEWFSQKHYDEDKIYFTPIDPELSIEEINRVRNLLCLDSIESKWKRQPWIEVITIEAYEKKFK